LGIPLWKDYVPSEERCQHQEKRSRMEDDRQQHQRTHNPRLQKQRPKMQKLPLRLLASEPLLLPESQAFDASPQEFGAVQ
jgi:hypothetical protein